MTPCPFSSDSATNDEIFSVDRKRVTWNDSRAEPVINGEEEDDRQYIRYYDGNKNPVIGKVRKKNMAKTDYGRKSIGIFFLFQSMQKMLEMKKICKS